VGETLLQGLKNDNKSQKPIEEPQQSWLENLQFGIDLHTNWKP
jgi:hypothetical protein